MYCGKNCAQLVYINQEIIGYPMYCEGISGFSGYIGKRVFLNLLYGSISPAILPNPMGSEEPFPSGDKSLACCHPQVVTGPRPAVTHKWCQVPGLLSPPWPAVTPPPPLGMPHLF